MLVKATGESARLNVKIKEARRVVNEGEYLDVTPLRFNILNGNNRYKVKFVIPVEEIFEREDIEMVDTKEEKDTVEVKVDQKKKKRGRKQKSNQEK